VLLLLLLLLARQLSLGWWVLHCCCRLCSWPEYEGLKAADVCNNSMSVKVNRGSAVDDVVAGAGAVMKTYCCWGVCAVHKEELQVQAMSLQFVLLEMLCTCPRNSPSRNTSNTFHSGLPSSTLA
jgi:hypothetical protein